jgi:NagD protein
MRRGYLIDMDGVLYRGAELIPGADRFIGALRRRRIPFLLVTNNSQRTQRDVVLKLAQMDLPVEEEHVFTCAMATARFIAGQKPGARVFVVGEGGLLTALHLNGCVVDEKAPDYVVVGEGRVLNFELVERALRFLTAGARLVATNLDPSCPTEQGVRPGCGSIVALLEAASGLTAFSVGKPSPLTMRLAARELSNRRRIDEVTMVGDTMETDILGGLQMGYRTVLVLTGSANIESLARYAYAPTRVVASIAELVAEAEEDEPGNAGRRASPARARRALPTPSGARREIPGS